jgi:hypothetical protein
VCAPPASTRARRAVSALMTSRVVKRQQGVRSQAKQFFVLMFLSCLSLHLSLPCALSPPPSGPQQTTLLFTVLLPSNPPVHLHSEAHADLCVRGMVSLRIRRADTRWHLSLCDPTRAHTSDQGLRWYTSVTFFL